MTGLCTTLETPTSVVLLGATGDLARKKLLTALLDLRKRRVLPEHFHVVAFARDAHTTETYRAFVREQIALQRPNHPEADVQEFLACFEYVQGTFEDADSFARIKAALEAYDTSIGMCTSKLFYLAVPPVFYDTIFTRIAGTQLEQPCIIGEGWTRILVEKPFGSDLENAQYLESRLNKLFAEEQIYRIDHYLAKDALQNILAFRFSNSLFEDKWNKDFVEAVYLRVFESFDVSARGAFFDGVGALRDVGQNHMLQMLALIAMRRPATLSAEALREKRAEVLGALILPDAADIGTSVIKGQYEGYRATANVAADSRTETYFALRTGLSLPEWDGVPFYLEHGKAMNESVSDITIRFRSSHTCVCGESARHDHPNLVRFTIGPDQKITVRFWVRKPGSRYTLEPNDLVFDRAQNPTTANATDAYEEVLFDAICGDQTLFVSSDEQTAAWRYVTTILRAWHDAEPQLYAPGSDGPASALQSEIHEHIRLLH